MKNNETSERVSTTGLSSLSTKDQIWSINAYVPFKQELSGALVG